MSRPAGAAASERVESPFRRETPAPAGETTLAETPPAQALPAAEASVRADDLRPLSGYEEELLERRGEEENTARLVGEILARCLLPPGTVPGAGERRRIADLPVAERDRLLVELRRKSLGDRVETRVDCPSCGATSEVDFSLADLPLDFDPPPRRIEVKLPDGRVAVLRTTTAGDQEALLDLDTESRARRRSWLIARAVVRLGDRQGPFEAEEVHGWPSGVRQKLEHDLAEAAGDFDLRMAVHCAKCGEDFTAPFDVAAFFFAELRQRAASLLSEVHQLATRYHWSEHDILALGLDRRLAYRLLIERDHDAALTAALGV